MCKNAGEDMSVSFVYLTSKVLFIVTQSTNVHLKPIYFNINFNFLIPIESM